MTSCSSMEKQPRCLQPTSSLLADQRGQNGTDQGGQHGITLEGQYGGRSSRTDLRAASISLPVKVALLAMEVSEAALSALGATSAALGCHEQRIEPLVRSRDSVQPVQPETPQLLPVVHTLWAPVLQALKVGQLPLMATLLPAMRMILSAGKIFVLSPHLQLLTLCTPGVIIVAGQRSRPVVSFVLMSGGGTCPATKLCALAHATLDDAGFSIARML